MLRLIRVDSGRTISAAAKRTGSPSRITPRLPHIPVRGWTGSDDFLVAVYRNDRDGAGRCCEDAEEEHDSDYGYSTHPYVHESTRDIKTPQQDMIY